MAAEPKPGLVMILTGDGKGKTTSALGSALRAAGQGLSVLVIQFIKGGRSYGELAALENIPGVKIRPMGLGLIRKGEDQAPHREKARQAWQMALAEAASGAWDMLILDELFAAHNRGFVTLKELVDFVGQKPRELHLILTGRGCPEELAAKADMVTRMEPVKHHLKSGVKSRRGIEF